PQRRGALVVRRVLPGQLGQLLHVAQDAAELPLQLGRRLVIEPQLGQLRDAADLLASHAHPIATISSLTPVSPPTPILVRVPRTPRAVASFPPLHRRRRPPP